MSAIRAINNVVAADLDLTPGSINQIGIYDHHIPRLQDFLYEAKQFKTANNYKYCWTKNSAITYVKMMRRELISLTGSAISPLCDHVSPRISCTKSERVICEWFNQLNMDLFFYFWWESETKLR